MIGALSGYHKSWFRHDLVAGVSVAAVAVPIAIAYSQLAGVPPVYGLYASLLPLVAYAFLGSSRQLIVAPDAATCAIIAAVVAPLAGQDPARYVSLAAALAMIAGLFCIAAGLARLGFLTNFLARPILTGYLNGIAISIIAGQLGGLFGFSVAPAGFFRLTWGFFSKLGETRLTGRLSRSARPRWPSCCCSRAWRRRSPAPWSPSPSASSAPRSSASPRSASGCWARSPRGSRP